jgi:hypothetical protein
MGKFQKKPYLKFDELYGKAFRVAQTPSGKATDSRTGEVLPDDPNRYSIVTPQNGDAWNWPTAAPEAVQHAKLNWKQFVGNRKSKYKVRQIRKSMN